MSAYDNILEEKSKNTYKNLDTEEVFSSFKYSCRLCDTENATKYALDLYLSNDLNRDRIIKELFVVALSDKGIANTILYPQLYQLLAPLINRKEKETVEDIIDEEEEKWLYYDDSEEFSVSNKGNVVDYDGNDIEMTYIGPFLTFKFGKETYYLGNTVAKLFVKNKQQYKFIKYKDGNRENNNYKNLIWTKKYNSSLKVKKLPLEEFFIVNPDEIVDDDDMNSYILRFLTAVHLVASSESCKINTWCLDLFSDEIESDIETDEDEEKFKETHGSPEFNRDLFKTAIENKNIANALYHARVLSFHPSVAIEKTTYGKIKASYSYIWDTFNIVCKNAPIHVKHYLNMYINLSKHPDWSMQESNRLLYIQFIHMWCLDPITAHLRNKKGDKEKTLETPWGQISGFFSNDFIKRVKSERTMNEDNKWSKSTFKYHADIGDLEPLLFSIDVADRLIEPSQIPTMSQDGEVYGYEYVDTWENSILDFPDFVEVIENFIDDDEYKVGEIEPENMKEGEKLEFYIRSNSKIERVNKFWYPLSVFYLFFNYYNSPGAMRVIEEIYDTRENFFKNEMYPNPFVEKTDITETEYLSFKPYIGQLLRLGLEHNLYTDMTPKERQKVKLTSTLEFRTSSPVTKNSPVVIRTPREKPKSPILTSPTIGVATQRKITPKPKRSPKTERSSKTRISIRKRV